ncbi:MAG: TlpA disulfide reductase family protein [Bacteroidota bacterium]
MAIRMLVIPLLAGLLAAPLEAPAQTKAPDFSLTDARGGRVQMASLKGKVVAVNFWATWCPPCRAEIPGFIEVYRKFREKGLEIVGVSLDRQGWTVVRPYLKKNPIEYPVVIGDAALADAYGGVEAIPTTVLVDRSGKIVKRHVGYLSRADFEKMLAGLL